MARPAEDISMTATPTSSRAGAGAHRHALIERRLRRYSPAAQARVCAVAQRHPRLADLAVSFPPLLFALALPRRGADPEPAIVRAIHGRPLPEITAAAAVPRWLRRLPVDGLTRPLPRLPDGEPFGRRIANHVPRSPKLAVAWLDMVSDGAQWGSEPFAIWIAREIVRDPKMRKTQSLRLLALWAWFSAQPETDGYRLMATPWRCEMGYAAAVSAARAWLDRVTLELNLGGRPVADLWLRPGPFEDHVFVPLDSAERIAEEAAAMENCMVTCGYGIADNWSRLWSIRKDGRRIADLEVRQNRRRPLVHINQLTVARNKAAPIELWWLAARWLHQHDLLSIRPVPRTQQEARPDVEMWRKVWRPYWRAKRRIPAWLPLAPSWWAVDGLG
jgi:hypothetical protein